VGSGLDDQGRQAGHVREYGADEAESGRPGGSALGADHTDRTGRSPRPCAEIHRISTAVPPPLHEVLEGKQVSPLRCRLIVQVAEGAELKVYPGSDGLFAAHADQLNADLTDFAKT
jgi:hypothetical protein